MIGVRSLSPGASRPPQACPAAPARMRVVFLVKESVVSSPCVNSVFGKMDPHFTVGKVEDQNGEDAPLCPPQPVSSTLNSISWAAPMG